MADLKSYTSASTLPVKLLQNTGIIERIKGGFIPPVHVQLNPTNRCNLNCGFCSCSERDKNLELKIDRLIQAMVSFKALGCQAVTITGGGEPLLYKNLNILMAALRQGMDIKIGLVSNGTQFKNLHNYQDTKWCRISSSDDREPDWQGISRAIRTGNGINWAFSYVLTRTPNWDNLSKTVDFANRHDFTHVRVVGDILDAEEADLVVDAAREQLLLDGVDDSRVIYQGRAQFTRGQKRCYISLLKPIIGADGGVYPCCGVQYAQDTPGRDYVESMRIGWLEDIEKIWGEQVPFDGSGCTRCYYGDYNTALDLLAAPIDHAEFV